MASRRTKPRRARQLQQIVPDLQPEPLIGCTPLIGLHSRAPMHTPPRLLQVASGVISWSSGDTVDCDSTAVSAGSCAAGSPRSSSPATPQLADNASSTKKVNLVIP